MGPDTAQTFGRISKRRQSENAGGIHSGTADQIMSASHAFSDLERISDSYSVENISVFVNTPTLSWRTIEDNVLDFWRAIN